MRRSAPRLHHLTVVVADLDAAVAYWRAALGAEPIFEALPARSARTARLPLGDAWLILVEPQGEHGAPAQFLAAHGPGLFLMSLAAERLEDDARAAAARGVPLEGPARDALAGWRVQDLAADPASGIRAQLCEDPSASG